MARYIVKDEKYSKEIMVFESYQEMIEKVRAICREKGLEFSEKDEKKLKYRMETVLDT
ncbi:MAG: hypothetical protein ABFD70_07225 [Syntrophaceae bacterium]|nr:hypothetical protein [Deltaproteobacteria bacterium]